jgi:hypothetical protein
LAASLDAPPSGGTAAEGSLAPAGAAAWPGASLRSAGALGVLDADSVTETRDIAPDIGAHDSEMACLE